MGGDSGILNIIGRHLDPLNIFNIGGSSKKSSSSQQQQQMMPQTVQTPTESDPAVALAAAEERRRRQAARGIGSTILTSGLGTAGTDKKTLLG